MSANWWISLNAQGACALGVCPCPALWGVGCAWLASISKFSYTRAPEMSFCKYFHSFLLRSTSASFFLFFFLSAYHTHTPLYCLDQNSDLRQLKEEKSRESLHNKILEWLLTAHCVAFRQYFFNHLLITQEISTVEKNSTTTNHQLTVQSNQRGPTSALQLHPWAPVN